MMSRTKPSELSPVQAQKAPEKLEQKTRSLEKRLLLRHFISKALEIRRAEVAAEEERRSQALKEFIRVPAVSPPIQPQFQPEDEPNRQSQEEPQEQSPDQPQTYSVFSVVEQARQQAVAEKENKLEDLLTGDFEDLIDFSNDPQAPPVQAPPTGVHSFQDLDGLRGLLMPQQTVRDIADKAEGDALTQRAVSDEISEPKRSQSPQLALQPPNTNLNMPDIEAQHRISDKTLEPSRPMSPQLDSQSPNPESNIPNINPQCHISDEMSEPKHPESPHVALQFPTPDSGMPDVDAQSMASGHGSETSPTTTATPSIFSHASTLSSNSSFSVRSITEAELRERDAKMQPLPKRSSYAAPPSQIVRRKAVRSLSSGSPALGRPRSPQMTSSPSSSPTIHEDAELNPSAMSRVSTGDSTTPTAPELSPRSKSENAVYQLNTAAEPSLQGIDKPDAEGFPWVVQVARDGDETKLKRLIVSGADLEAVHTTTKRSALCEASIQGHSKVVDILIHEGCLPDHADAESYTAFHHACHKGHLAIAKSLIAANADIEAPGPQRQTPLHLAAQVPHRNVVMLLLQRNANINARDVDYRTPLHISAAQGNVEMCNYFLDNGAQLDNRDSQSRTALQLACEEGHYESAEAMLKRSNLKATDLTFLTAFFAAVEYGHVRIAESFLARGLDLQKLNKNDIYKPATLAAKNGSLAMLELMIRGSCSIKAKDDNDWNALHFAAQQGHWQLIEPLVANDVSVKAATRMKDTPLILAVKGGHFTATEILLRSKGISVTVEDAQAQQPIHQATRAGSFEVFNLLISNGAKIAVENAFGWHPIHIAVAYGHTALVDRLTEQFARVEEKLGSSSVKKDQTHRMVEDGYWAEARWPYPGSRPLHLACEYGHYQIASNLISKGAKLEASCSEGWRPLHHASFNGSSALVELLLNTGCYPWAETDEGLTPQGLQFRTAGSPIPEEEKDKVRLLLQEAMDRTTKQNDTKSFKVGLKKGRTVEEKHNLIRAVTFSMEMAAKSSKQSTKPHRPHPAHPLMPHTNTFPSAVPTIHHPAQATQPSPSPLLERPVSSSSNRPSITLSESDLKKVPIITSPASSLSNLPSTGQSESSLEKTTSNTALAPRSAKTVALQHSMGPMQGLPGLPLNLMKNKFKLKRASTLGADMSKQGIEKMSTGLDMSKQGIEKMSSYGLDVSKQGYTKMSSYSQNMSKQGMNMSKQGMEKMKKMNLMRRKKLAKQDADNNDGNDGGFQLSSEFNNNSQGSDGNAQGPSQGSGNLEDLSQNAEGIQNAGGNQGGTGDTTSLNSQSDDNLQYNSGDDAASISAFTMGGFDTYDDGGDGGDNGGDYGGDGGDGC